VKGAWWVDSKELNSEQREIISLPIDDSHLVTGPPGCGKTKLLILRANFLSIAGYANILILVFTRTLQEFIRSGSKEYAFPDSSVMTSRSWQTMLLKEYDYDASVTGGGSEQREELLKRLNSMVAEHQLGHIYDAIFLDEAQDYLADEIDLFRRLTPRLFAVADSRQHIYDGPDPFEKLKAVTDHHHPLKYHYRSGRRICQAADSLRRGDNSYSPLTPTSQYDEISRPSTVEKVACSDWDHLADELISRLKLQMKAYPEELLGVIAPRREDVELIGERLLSSEIGAECVVQKDSDYISFKDNPSICVCGIHAAKGLEFRAAHLVGGDYLPVFREKQKRLAYTGITRAKTSLAIYTIQSIPGYLEQAINSANSLPEIPTLDDVFRRRK
jgi:superfamily I DNA/RNA helicase